MSGWKAKRFWQAAEVVAVGSGFAVHLDGRPVRTPAKTPLVVPTRGLAQAIADEWNAQDGEVRPLTMPFTRSANAALDKVATQYDEVAAMIAEYGGSDLLCYRAATPAELAARQAEAWDPLLDWAELRFGVRLVIARGVMHIAQPPEAQAALYAEVRSMGPFVLTGLHDLVGLSGSLIIGLAVKEGHLDAMTGWTLSRVDEDWQAEQWGKDEVAEALARHKQGEFLHARRFVELTTAV